ncbi:MAG: SMC family ATPase [Candidatus Helarchaeota archaeon]|nr:SMC family ATPase [Candidatus Helarchaeota archaeon]
MTLRKMQSINFKSIKDQTVPLKKLNFIELPNGLYLIRGRNSSGKSVFVESMMWGTWGGKGPRKCGIISEIHDKIIRQTSAKQQKSTCKVSIDFEVNNQKYNIIRSKDPNKPATVKFARIEKDTQTGEEIKTGILTDSLKVCEKLYEIFNCTSDEVQKTFYVRQGEVDYLATRTASELREHFETLFKLKDFTDELKGTLDEMINSVDGTIASLEKEKSDIESQKEKLEYIKTQKTQNEEELQKYSEKMKDIQANLKRYPELANIKQLIQITDQELSLNNKISIKNEKLEGEIKNKKEIEAIIKKREGSKDKIFADINKDKKLLATFPDLEDLKQISEKHDTINTLTDQRTKNIEKLLQKGNEMLETTLPSDLEPLKETLENQNLSSKNNLNELKADLESKNKEMLNISEEISKFKALKGELENNISLLSEKNECPTCLTPIEHESHKNEILARIKEKIETHSKEEAGLKEKKESTERKITELKSSIDKINVKQGDIEKLLNDLENILGLNSEITEKEKELKSLFSKLKVASVEELLKKHNISDLSELISNIDRTNERLNQNQSGLEKITSEIAELNTRLGEINEQAKIIKSEIDELQNKLRTIKDTIGKTYQKLGIIDLDDYLGKFNTDSLENLKDKIAEIQNEKKTTQENIDRLNQIVSQLDSEIKEIQEKIKLLDVIKKKIEKKQRISNHLNAIKKQYLDKFISQEVIQNKLFKSVRNEVSGYLLQFSDGQYVLKEVRPAGRDKKGIEFLLFDNFDGIDKTMDYLSGGDKAVFGLALRIGLSNLMARIKPFKTSEIKPINFDMLILDEPLSNMDARRRERVIRHLNDDRNFSQIFLITHTPELDDEQFNHRLLVTKTSEGGSKYKLIPRLSRAD